MSEFVADLREPRIPTVCEDFDNDEFVADIRPQGLSFKSDSNMEMDVSCWDKNSGFPTDEHLQGLLSSNQFSRDQIAGLIQRSTETLIRKLLYGRSIASIEGQVKISLDDEPHLPILINFNHNDKSKHCSPLTLVNDEFNVKVRGQKSDNVVLRSEYHHENSLSDSEFATLKFVDQSYLIPRRGSDADSGYGGKSADDSETGQIVEEQMNLETTRLVTVTNEERFCSSVDSVCTMLGSDLRYQREPSCEKLTAGQTSPASETWEELDDEGSELVIDESYDTEAQSELTVTKHEAPEENKLSKKTGQMNIDTNVLTPTDESNFDQQRQYETCHAESQQRSPSLPVDLSGDSEDPRGSPIAHAKNLVLCKNLSPTGLICRLCHTITDNAEELSRHAVQAHNLFACVRCFQSFTTTPQLKSHVCFEPVYAEAQEPIIHGFDRPEEQVLDLSVKKRPGVNGDDKLNDTRSNKLADSTGELSRQPGQNVSRDGYGQPVSDSPLSNTGSSNDAYRCQEMPHLQSFSDLKNCFVSIKTEPECGTSSPSTQHFLLTGSRNVYVPCKTENSSDAPLSLISPEGKTPLKHVPNTPERPSIRFSPYSREILAELTAKFIASRKAVPTTLSKENLGSTETAIGEKGMKTVGHLRGDPKTSAQGTAKVNGEISREVSMSETALKNRVNAFVKNGGHQAQAEASVNFKFNSDSAAAKQTDGQKSFSMSHSAVKNTSGTYTCSHEGCGEEFACFQALERHSVDSHGRYLCEHCGKTFTARPNRDRHVRYHTGERPYKCDICPMAFFRGDDLKYHRTTRHPAAEPFVCKRCNRNFTWNRDLERHQRHCRCKA